MIRVKALEVLTIAILIAVLIVVGWFAFMSLVKLILSISLIIFVFERMGKFYYGEKES